MQIQRQWLEELIFEGEASRRFTQDSPVLPDVWLEYGERYARGDDPHVDLLLTPHASVGTGALFRAVHARLHPPQDAGWSEEHVPDEHELAANKATVVVRLTFGELLRVLLPLTGWWQKHVCTQPGRATAESMDHAAGRHAAGADLERVERGQTEHAGPPELLWLIRLVGSIGAAAALPDDEADGWAERRAAWERILADADTLGMHFHELVGDPGDDSFLCPPALDPPPLFLVSRNRDAFPTLLHSVRATKADAARRLFEASCAGLAWAVVDSGVDATHRAFRRLKDDGTAYPEPFEAEPGRFRNRTRVEATFDFTRVRQLLSAGPVEMVRRTEERIRELEARGSAADAPRLARLEEERRRWQAHADDPERIATAADLRRALLSGRTVDWEKVRPFVEVPHDPSYVAPRHEHGTHVAGILAADWRPEHWPDEDDRPDETIVGICPDLRVYDFRVFDDEGRGDEFSVMAALQFIRHMNAHRDLLVVHGANLSLAIRHDVANYACGRTPVCDESERLVKTGVVVVAAAGNYGYNRFSTLSDAGAPSTYEGYSLSSITDPGNAEAVITVGSTHRMEPHTYGVSYFSSRGPTGDGRYKPDLLAPGEKILAPIPGNAHKVKDGTSMAAPHVSGAAALILARHREFVGHPDRVKQVLCSTATDLGRDRYFQGAGMVDVLRALQSL